MKNGDMPASPMFNEHGAPIHHSGGVIRDGVCAGLTKRELLAAMAMQGLAANASPQVSSWNAEQTARCATAFADALLARLVPKPLTPAQQAQEAQTRG